MKYFTVDYMGKLKEITEKQALKRTKRDNNFIAYKDGNYTLMSDCANDIEVMKNAILRMLQEHICFDF